jgi:hypothetical protein
MHVRELARARVEIRNVERRAVADSGILTNQTFGGERSRKEKRHHVGSPIRGSSASRFARRGTNVARYSMLNRRPVVPTVDFPDSISMG